MTNEPHKGGNRPLFSDALLASFRAEMRESGVFGNRGIAQDRAMRARSGSFVGDIKPAAIKPSKVPVGDDLDDEFDRSAMDDEYAVQDELRKRARGTRPAMDAFSEAVKNAYEGGFYERFDDSYDVSRINVLPSEAAPRPDNWGRINGRTPSKRARRVIAQDAARTKAAATFADRFPDTSRIGIG
jgi:hypothetical protein